LRKADKGLAQKLPPTISPKELTNFAETIVPQGFSSGQSTISIIFCLKYSQNENAIKD